MPDRISNFIYDLQSSRENTTNYLIANSLHTTLNKSLSLQSETFGFHQHIQNDINLSIKLTNNNEDHISDVCLDVMFVIKLPDNVYVDIYELQVYLFFPYIHETIYKINFNYIILQRIDINLIIRLLIYM